MRITGIDKTAGENTDVIVKKLVEEKLGVNMVKLRDEDIDRCHRVGKPNTKSKKPRIIFDNFTSYKPRSTVFKQRLKKTKKNPESQYCPSTAKRPN